MRSHTRALGLLLVLVLWAGTACGSDSNESMPASSSTGGALSGVLAAARSLDIPIHPSTPFLTALPTGYRLEVVLDGLDLPTSLAATPDGRLLITEQEAGRVRVVQDGVLLSEPWFELPVHIAEEKFVEELGLVTIAVDPLFAENGLVYIYYTERDEDGSRRTVFARLREVDGHGTDLRKLLTIDLAPEAIHIAGGIAFDREGAILLGVGDHERPKLAPRLDSLAGKVLRIDRDGNPLPDNPFFEHDDADPRVYAFGLRNPFGIAVDRITGRVFITENRNVAGDAVYELEAGADYGWPTHEVVLQEPLLIYDTPMGPAGITAYSGDALPAFTGDVFFCTFHYGGALHWSEPDEVAGFEFAKRDRLIAPGCSTSVTEGADGFLYFLAYGDGKLMRISR